MTDESPAPPPVHNLAEFSVSEISQAVKRTLEGTFDHVRVRGEVSRPNYHGSGHLYFTMKDDAAVLDAVCWRGTVGKLNLRVEEGMEVICTGRVSSYPRSSKYQLVVESVELAGEGALLKLLEDRRKRLAAEGLFDEERKKPLPFLPEVIGVVTSPTGAVFRDILHRLNDRFPRRVILWPVPVQGDGAAEKVAAAIAGFNALPPDGAVPRPDVLIVGRGGGSLEDLWAFNEEVVVRAAAASDIPLISAVGHETDTTLIDFASDKRAPTPTAAAEMAVPVRTELLTQVMDFGRRTVDGFRRMAEERRVRLEGLGRGLPDPHRLLESADQDVDLMTERLARATDNLFDRRAAMLDNAWARLRRPDQVVALAEGGLEQASQRLDLAAVLLMRDRNARFRNLDAEQRLAGGVSRSLRDAGARLTAAGNMLNSLSYERVLDRGYAVVRDADGQALSGKAETKPGADVEIEFADGRVGAQIHGDSAGSEGDGGTPRRKPAPKKDSRKDDVKTSQGSLF